MGVVIPISQVLSKTCSDPCTLAFPGGSEGPRRSTTRGVTTRLRAIHAAMTRRPSLLNIDEPVHVADRLHGAAEAVDPSGGAGHEALPPEVAGLAGVERELDRAMRHRQRARCVAALVLRIVRDP